MKTSPRYTCEHHKAIPAAELTHQQLSDAQAKHKAAKTALKQGRAVLLPVAVCKTDRVVYDPIERLAPVIHKMTPDGRVALYANEVSSQGFHPGVHIGFVAIIGPRDVKRFLQD